MRSDEKEPVYEVHDGNVIRNKFPRFTVLLHDECDKRKLGAALKKAGEYVIKRDDGKQ